MNEYFLRIFDDSGMQMGMMLSELMTNKAKEIKEQLTLIAQTIDDSHCQKRSCREYDPINLSVLARMIVTTVTTVRCILIEA